MLLVAGAVLNVVVAWEIVVRLEGYDVDSALFGAEQLELEEFRWWWMAHAPDGYSHGIRLGRCPRPG